MVATDRFMIDNRAFPSPAVQPQDAGQLGPRSVKTHSPSFGEKTAKDKESLTSLIFKVAACAVVIAASAAVGFLVGGLPGAVIGAAIAVKVLSTTAIVKSVIDSFTDFRLAKEVPQTPHPEGASRPGKYTKADIRLTKSADETLAWKKELISQAEASIEISGNYAGGTDFREVLDLIDTRMKQKERLKTHLLVSLPLLEDEDKAAIEKLKQAYGTRFEVLITDASFHFDVGSMPYSEENHVKMVVVDGKYFVAGGSGIHPRLCHEKIDKNGPKENPTMAAKFLEPTSRDTDIVGESSKIAEGMRHEFFNLWRLWETRTLDNEPKSRYFALTGAKGHSEKFSNADGLYKNVRLKYLVGGPEHRGNNAIVTAYAKRIRKAKEKIGLASLLFNPSKKIQKALQEARQNNPEMKMTAYLNGRCDSTFLRQLLLLAAKRHYHLMDVVYEYEQPDQLYHKKVATFDKSHMIIGSFNLGKKSAKFDHEIAFVIKDARLVATCEQDLKEDATRSRLLKREQIATVSPFMAVVGQVSAFLSENFF